MEQQQTENSAACGQSLSTDGLERTPHEIMLRKVHDEVQQALVHPAHQVYFRAGLIACREYMARFVEAESPTIAASIRANWWPKLGADMGPPRLLQWGELTEGEYGEPGFRGKAPEEIPPTLEALPIAFQFLGDHLRSNAELRGRPLAGGPA